MANAGTLATDPQIIFMLGENASANQIIEANVDFAILFAEAEIFLDTDRDFVSTIGALDANLKQSLALAASAKAAEILINQNPNSWQIATSTFKINKLASFYKDVIDRIKAVDL